MKNTTNPAKVVKVPERVDWDKKTEDWHGEDIEDHPANLIKLEPEQKDDNLQAINASNNDNRHQWQHPWIDNVDVNQV